MIIKREKNNKLDNIEPVKEGFKKVNELENRNFFLISNTLMVLIFIIGLYNILENADKKVVIIYFIITIVSIIPHELLHGLVFEGGLKSENTILNFNLKRGLVCCNYNGEMDKARMLFSLICPLIILTVIPSIGWWLGFYNDILKSLIIINLALSVGDILSFLSILKYTPRNSIIISRDYKNYYKEEI